MHIYCQSASEDVKVGGVLSTCVAMVKIISQIIHFMLIILINSNW